MQRTVYHCSPDEIEAFDFEYGVHFGGCLSALEAGYRKLNNVRHRDEYADQEFLYLYTNTLTVDTKKIYHSDDVGGTAEWAVVIERARKEGSYVIQYRNKYEPDSVPSFLVLEPSVIRLIKVEKLKENTVIAKLEPSADGY